MNRRFRNADGPAWNELAGDDDNGIGAICAAGTLKHASRTGRKPKQRAPKRDPEEEPFVRGRDRTFRTVFLR